MDIESAMKRGGVADITTTGRRSGLPRRIEIVFHHFDGANYLTGRPGRRRDWQANIQTTPRFTLHLKGDQLEDVDVVGEPEPDPVERGRIIRRALIESWDIEPEKADEQLQEWVASSPFIRFTPA